MWGQVAEKFTVLGVRVGERVVIANLSIVVVLGIRVPALAIIEGMSDRMVVVTLDTLDVVLVEQRKDTVRIRAEGTQITQAINRINATLCGIAESDFQCQVIAVDSAQTGNT